MAQRNRDMGLVELTGGDLLSWWGVARCAACCAEVARKPGAGVSFCNACLEQAKCPDLDDPYLELGGGD